VAEGDRLVCWRATGVDLARLWHGTRRLVHDDGSEGVADYVWRVFPICASWSIPECRFELVSMPVP